MYNLKLYIPAFLSFSSGVRELTQEAANLAGFNKRQINMLKLVIDELFMNAIRYGSDDTSHVFLEAFVDNDQIICAVEDEGKGKEIIKAEKLKEIIQHQTANVSLHKSHGRGLAQITSSLVQAFEVLDKETGGLRIEFVMKKQSEEEIEAKTNPIKKEKTKILSDQVIKLTGVIDLNNLEENADKVRAIFDKHPGQPFRLIFDFSELEYCNSSFLSYLAIWQNTLEELGGESVIHNPSEQILEIIDLVGLTSIFIVEKNNK